MADPVTSETGAIQDRDGNDADLSHDEVTTGRAYRVNAPPAPMITWFEVTSDAGSDDIYGVGETIAVSAHFSRDIIVDVSLDLPTLTIQLGDAAVTANHAGDGLPGRSIPFHYRIESGDSAPEGIRIEADAFNPGGSMVDSITGEEAVITEAAFGFEEVDSKVITNTEAATIESVAFSSDPGSDDQYGAGDTIEVTVTFSEEVAVDTTGGTPSLDIEVGDDTKTAAYASAGGRDVTFRYTVAVGDSDDDGVSIIANQISLNGGTIRSPSSIDADLSHDTVDSDAGHKVSAPGGL